jgi:hypothetical protein
MGIFPASYQRPPAPKSSESSIYLGIKPFSSFIVLLVRSRIGIVYNPPFRLNSQLLIVIFWVLLLTIRLGVEKEIAAASLQSWTPGVVSCPATTVVQHRQTDTTTTNTRASYRQRACIGCSCSCSRSYPSS